MTFRQWLKTIDPENDTREDVAMIAGDAATGVMPDLLDLHDFERWYRGQGANDDVIEAVRVAWLAFVEDTGATSEPPAPDPMGLPFMPGARTTLADARLQLVCAVIPWALKERGPGYGSVLAASVVNGAMRAMRFSEEELDEALARRPPATPEGMKDQDAAPPQR